MAVGDGERGFELIEKVLIEGDIFDAEVSAEDLNGEFVVFDSVDVLAELFDHNLLHDGFDHCRCEKVSI